MQQSSLAPLPGTKEGPRENLHPFKHHFRQNKSEMAYPAILVDTIIIRLVVALWSYVLIIIPLLANDTIGAYSGYITVIWAAVCLGLVLLVLRRSPELLHQ